MARTTCVMVVLAIVVWPTDSNANLIDDEIDLYDGLITKINLYHRYRTTLHFPSPPIQADLGDSENYTARRSLDGLRMTIDVNPMSMPTNLNLTFPGLRATVILQVVDSDDQAKPMYRFRDPRTSGKKSGTAQNSSQQSQGRWASQVIRIQTPAPRVWRGPGHTLELRPGVIQHTKDATLMPCVVGNIGDYPYPVTKLEVLDHLDRVVPSEVVQHSWMGAVADEQEIAPGETASFVFRIPQPSRIKKGWAVRVASTPAIESAEFEWTVNRGPPEPGILQDRVSIAFRMLGGTMKLDDGTGLGPALRAWTQLLGAGVLVSYGTGRHTNLEVSADFVRTGDARIGDSMIHATGGRLHFGGRLHTGKQLVPYARAGIGIMLAQHTVESMETEQTDTDFRASGLLFLGGGVNWLLGKRTVVGLSMLGNLPLGGDEAGPVLEVGLHVGVLLGR